MPSSTDNSDLKAMLAQADKGKRSWIIWVVVALAVAVGGFFLLRGPGPEAPEQAFRTAELTRGSLTQTVSATGSVQPTNEVEVGSEISGIIEEVLVDANDQVSQGDRLAIFDTDVLEAQVLEARATLASAQAAQAQAQAAYELSEISLRRTKDLIARNVRSQAELDSAQATLKEAQARVDQAKAQVAVARSQLNTREVQLSKAVILAPVNGIVLERLVDPGQTVAASLQAPELFRIAEDLKEMELQVDIDEADIGLVKEGMEARFSVDAYPDKTFPAMIKRILFAAQDDTGVVTYRAELAVDNSDLLLRPGMTAVADITVATAKDALLAQNAALRFQPRQVDTEAKAPERRGSGLLGMIRPRFPRHDDAKETGPIGRQLFILGPAGQPQPVEVETGISDGTSTAIHSPSLKAGDKVIIGYQAKTP